MSEDEDAAAEALKLAAGAKAPSLHAGWIVPAILGSALFMQNLNATVVTNALPAIAVALDADPLRLNLAITMYLLASAVFMPASGWAADKLGAKRVFMAAMVLYALSSAACGLSQTLPQLILARFAQGAAGAMMVPVGRLVLLRTTARSELVGAMSILTMPALLGPVVGPLIGGAIVTFADWRWIFFINLPIAVAGVLLVRAYVPNVTARTVSRIDLVGIGFTGVGLAAIIFGFENLGRSFLPPGAVAALFLGGAACLGLYWRHARGNPDAIIDLSIFRKRTFQSSVVGGAFMRMPVGAAPFLMAMLLQVAFGLSAFAAGAMTFIGAAGALLMKTMAPPILRRFGFRTVLLVNGLIVGCSFVAYSAFRPETPHWLIMALLAASGFFRSLQFTSLNALAFAEIDEAQLSRASTTSSMAQQLVQSVGIGLAAMLLHILMRLQGDTQVTSAAVAPVFIAFGLLSFASLLWFVRLPRDAADELSGRVSPPRR
jgi:EmrB/QacA subfamily drug resistance transporter